MKYLRQKVIILFINIQDQPKSKYVKVSQRELKAKFGILKWKSFSNFK